MGASQGQGLKAHLASGKSHLALHSGSKGGVPAPSKHETTRSVVSWGEQHQRQAGMQRVCCTCVRV